MFKMKLANLVVGYEVVENLSRLWVAKLISLAGKRCTARTDLADASYVKVL